MPRIRITLASGRDRQGNPPREKLGIEIRLEGEKDISQENIVQKEDIGQEVIVCKPDIEGEKTALTADYRSRGLEIEYEDERDKNTENRRNQNRQIRRYENTI